MTRQFSRGVLEDWEVVCVDASCYTIYRKDYNEEWQDEQGDNLAFDTAEEAEQYLRNTFNEGVEKLELRYCRACETEVDAVGGECMKCGQPTEEIKNATT